MGPRTTDTTRAIFHVRIVRVSRDDTPQRTPFLAPRHRQDDREKGREKYLPRLPRTLCTYAQNASCTTYLAKRRTDTSHDEELQKTHFRFSPDIGCHVWLDAAPRVQRTEGQMEKYPANNDI